MTQKTYTSEGVVLSRKNYAEADRILVLFTKHYGKITLLAKGVRKLSSKKRGHIEIFSKVKFSAVKGKSMDIITETETIDAYDQVRLNLNKISLAYYFCEVILKITKDWEDDIKLYRILVDSLFDLQHRINLKKLRKEFITKVLIQLGFWDEEKKLSDPDAELNEVIERKLNSVRVGRKVLE